MPLSRDGSLCTIDDVSVAVEFDRERQWVRVRVTDQFTASDAVGVIRTARADAEHQMWPMLVDATSARNALSDEDVDEMVAAVREAARRQGTRGHVALVADDDVLFSRLLRYEAQTALLGVRVIRVFRELRDADEWLRIMSVAWKFGESGPTPA